MADGMSCGEGIREENQNGHPPRSPWQLFRLTLRTRFAGLCRLNLMTAAAWLPLILLISCCLVSFFNVLVIDSQYAEYVKTGAPGDLTADQLAAWAQAKEPGQAVMTAGRQILFFFCLWCIPCLLILGPVQAGLASVTGQWARDEHAFLWADFKDAVKAHWKQALGVSAITAVTPLTVFICWQFYGQQAQSSAFFLVPQLLIPALGIVWFLGLTYMYPLLIAYSFPFGRLLLNGLLLAVGRLPQTLGLRLLTLLPALLCTALFLISGSLIPFLFLGGYYLLIGNALARFIFASASNAALDRFLPGGTEGGPAPGA